MSRSSPGLAFSFLMQDDHEAIAETCQVVMQQTGKGRLAVLLWDLDLAWGPESPRETWVTETFLGKPRDRQGSDVERAFKFFGNLIIRCYSDDPVEPSRVVYALMFRRAGEPAYVRRKHEQTPLTQDLLDTKQYSFTRDVANNVWHLPDSHDTNKMIVGRLSHIVCWSDEDIVEVEDGKKRIRNDLREVTILSLIGKAIKTQYDWVTGQTALEI